MHKLSFKTLNIKITIDIDCAYGVWMNLSSCSESTSDSEWYVQVRSITPESNDEDDLPRNCDETLIRYNSCKGKTLYIYEVCLHSYIR